MTCHDLSHMKVPTVHGVVHVSLRLGGLHVSRNDDVAICLSIWRVEARQVLAPLTSDNEPLTTDARAWVRIGS
jgi:hypothetical protein